MESFLLDQDTVTFKRPESKQQKKEKKRPEDQQSLKTILKMEQKCNNKKNHFLGHQNQEFR